MPSIEAAPDKERRVILPKRKGEQRLPVREGRIQKEHGARTEVAIFILLACFLSGCFTGGTRWAPGTPYPTWADRQRVFDESQMGQKIKHELKVYVKERQEQIDARETKLKAMEERLRGQSPQVKEEKEAFKKGLLEYQSLVKRLDIEVQENKNVHMNQFNAAFERAMRAISARWTPGSEDPNVLVIKMIDREGGFKDVQAPHPSTLKLEDLRATLAQVQDSLTALVTQLSVRFKDLSLQRVAILPIVGPSEKASDPVGAYLTDKITNTFFIAGQAKVVEHTAIDKIMAELALGNSGRYDDTSAQRVGRLLAADTLIRGKYTEISEGIIEITARAISVETGEIVGVGSTTIPASLLPNLLNY